MVQSLRTCVLSMDWKGGERFRFSHLQLQLMSLVSDGCFKCPKKCCSKQPFAICLVKNIINKNFKTIITLF